MYVPIPPCWPEVQKLGYVLLSQFVQASSVHQKAESSIPGQGTCQCCRLIPDWGVNRRKPIGVSLSCRYLFLKAVYISSDEDMKRKHDHRYMQR